FAEHDAIIAAISSRDAVSAAALMRAHIKSVRDRVLPALGV
ncbi:MAG: FCD domain-containing protein, partial [Alphaproteobacteria bacterium]|nr:FCD domain-containing protein [Alphaproteobacteria bacterium]